jgi:hypothetical protein
LYEFVRHEETETNGHKVNETDKEEK